MTLNLLHITFNYYNRNTNFSFYANSTKNSTLKQNGCNTLTKFYVQEEEIVKKLNFFNPDKLEIPNLFQLTYGKADQKKNDEVNKNMEKLRECNNKYITI